ncbi:Crp/Fnr family transcriptional regulator [Marinoscillum furvescens]|uniref:CRP-like cAMP-binding protein n=1 Tax=Marinoscillum furvescens DSM 4134 TaxID=1122208 RepID=A0A3D9KWJ9_MARFU|nr:Crp/Fnr family transcriptional regulator [Marinoscillum furvescens]RED92220.1 CRP-like cAMP-binding protein [Marinoscillum furvescens DSM 4134]
MKLLLANIAQHLSLPDKDLNKLTSYWKSDQLKKGQFLLQSGQVCKFDTFVLKGSLKASIHNKSTHKEEIIFFAIDDWWATDLHSFHHQSPSYMTIQALEDCEVVKLSHKNFELLLEAYPTMERYFRLILQSHSAALTRRIYHRNALSAQERYLSFLKEYPQLNARIPQYLIASYLGMSAEMLSKIRSQLRS